jgi:hypothetical protein
LHFGAQQIFWECNELSACETFPEGVFRGINYDSMMNMPSSTADLKTFWSSIVHGYTRRSLTKGSDKLPALSGIAKDFGYRLGAPYLAGIWQNEDILQQLAWYVNVEASDLRDRPGSKAPTWSWASVDGPVTHMEPGELDYSPIAKVVHAEVTLDGEDATGAVKGGFMLAEGPLYCVPARSRDAILDQFCINFDVASKPMGDLYLFTLYSDVQKDFSGYSRHARRLRTWKHLVLVTSAHDSSSLERCGLAVGKNARELNLDQTTLQIGDRSGPGTDLRIKIF